MIQYWMKSWCASNLYSIKTPILSLKIILKSIKFREQLKLISVTIENVLKCMEHVWEQCLNWIFLYVANIKCKINVQKSCRATEALFVR